MATIIRVPYVKSLNNTEDFLYATIEVAIWSSCELGLGMTAANCATLRPLFRKLLPSLGFQSSGGRSKDASNVHYLATADAQLHWIPNIQADRIWYTKSDPKHFKRMCEGDGGKAAAPRVLIRWDKQPII